MKRCGGEYTLDDAIGEAKTLEEMAEAASAFPGIVRTDGWMARKAKQGDAEAAKAQNKVKEMAIKDVKEKAFAEADAWCSKRDCKVGDCHQLGYPEITILDIGENEIKEGTFEGIIFYSVTAKVTKVKCGCQKPKEKKKAAGGTNEGTAGEHKKR